MDQHQRNYVYPTSTSRGRGGGYPPPPSTRPPRRPSSTNNLQKPVPPTTRRASMMKDSSHTASALLGDRRASLTKNSSSRRANSKNRRASMRDSSHNNASFRGSSKGRRVSVSELRRASTSVSSFSMKDYSTASMRNLTDQQRVAIGKSRTQTLQDIIMDTPAAQRRTSLQLLDSTMQQQQLDTSGGTNTTSSSSDDNRIIKRGKPERSRSRGSIMDVSIDQRLSHSEPQQDKARRSSMTRRSSHLLPKNSHHTHNTHKRSPLPASASTPDLQHQHRSSMGSFSTEKFITDVTAPNRRRIGEKPTAELCDDGLFWIKRKNIKSFKKLKKSTSQPNGFAAAAQQRNHPSLKQKIYKGYLNWRQS